MNQKKLDNLLLFCLLIISIISFLLMRLSNEFILDNKIVIGIILVTCSTISFAATLAKQLQSKPKDGVQRFKPKYALLAIILLTLSCLGFMIAFILEGSIVALLAIGVNIFLILLLRK